MARRVRGRRGEGSVFQRNDGRWVASFHEQDGHRRQFYARSRQEALDKLDEARRRVRQGLKLTPDKRTLDEFLTTWLESKRGRVRYSTWNTYRGHLQRYVIGRPIGKRQLIDVRAEQLTAHYRSLETEIAPQTVRHVATILRQAFRSAVRERELDRNPAEFAEPPRAERVVMRTLTREQVASLLTAAWEDQYKVDGQFWSLYVLAVTTGMRLGEILGLRWRDVDRSYKALSVTRSLTVNGQRSMLTEPKSASSRRRVALSRTAAEALQTHRMDERDRIRRGLRGVSPNPEFKDLVFVRNDGEPLDPRRVTTKLFGRLLKAADLPHIRMHDLRHTAATLLLDAGEHPKVVSAMLGHSDIRTTLNLYSHVSDAMTAKAAQSMDELLGWREDS